MTKITTDIGTAAALHPRESLFRTSALASVSADTAIRADGAQSFFLNLTGAFVATLVLEGSNDGTNYFPIALRPYNAASKLLVVSVTTTGQWIATNHSFTTVRVRCSAYTSGTANFTISASTGALDQTLESDISTSTGTATGTAAAAVTLTLAAPGAGLRQYINMIRIERHASALLVAAATPIIITTTNLPGSRAYSIPVEAATAGTVYEKVEILSRPLAASAQNTAVTIVAGAVTSVIWRITADFYVAP